jgi:Ca2+/Na+ antiporter
MDEYPLERQFYKFFNRIIFWYIFCYVYRVKSMKKRKQQHDEDEMVEMSMTTTKSSLGNASTRLHMKKFKGLEQNKDHWSIGK